MFEELEAAIVKYHGQWNNLTQTRTEQDFFSGLQPTAVGWKTTDLADFDRRYAELRDICDQIHLGWVNERWLATMHLKSGLLPWGLTVVKLMQRRPGSSDAVGLDHIDFYVPAASPNLKSLLTKEPGLKWTEEKNGDHCKWISVWFDHTEAKLRGDTVLEVCAAELSDVQEAVLK